MIRCLICFKSLGYHHTIKCIFGGIVIETECKDYGKETVKKMTELQECTHCGQELGTYHAHTCIFQMAISYQLKVEERHCQEGGKKVIEYCTHCNQRKEAYHLNSCKYMGQVQSSHCQEKRKKTIKAAGKCRKCGSFIGWKHLDICGHGDSRVTLEQCDIPPEPEKESKEIAKRKEVNFRYDILDTNFLHMMAEIAHYGADKYGDLNWQKSRLEGGKSPINHIYDHLRQYRDGIPHDHFNTKCHQLAAIAFNAMMEFYYARKEEVSIGDDNKTKTP